ncbi:hypothetical protein FHS72_001918 [Loktanella ponticola]|uniref:Transposase DDE domain-containing protein n=1 Tax=Yoonia ponticola TaxID=1524255 RepID=A0A7W9BKP4_9RHOB|nr:hypothetical protein [Yoonia ponticola]
MGRQIRSQATVCPLHRAGWIIEHGFSSVRNAILLRECNVTNGSLCCYVGFSVAFSQAVLD